jgi:hypothetical protein
MKSEIVLEYSSEGAPLVIADVASALHWGGSEYDGAGVIVEYMARGLPRELMATKKPGMQAKKFKALAEAKDSRKARRPHSGRTSMDRCASVIRSSRASRSSRSSPASTSCRNDEALELDQGSAIALWLRRV